MINILEEIEIILRTHGKESNPLFESICGICVLSLNNGDTITNPYDISNTFNNYFAFIAETTKKSINYSHKHFSDYLSNKSSSTIFLEPAEKEEIANIISSFNSKKSSGPNSIPYGKLFLLKNEISKQLKDLFNISFMTGVFPSVLKLQK